MAMRRLTFISTAALGLALAGAAMAAPSSSTPLVVQGSTPQICTVQEPELAPGALVNVRGINGTTLQIDQLTDPATLATRAASASVSFDTVCNYPHRIKIESLNNGLWRGGAAGATPPQGFADGVPYTATMDWGDVNHRFEADASTRRLKEESVLVDNARAGQILLRLEIQPGASNLRSNAPLIAGTYTDTLRVTVEPQ